MTDEEKQLLLKDLCARLPYGVKAKITEESVLSYDSGSGIGVIVGKEYVDNEIFILQGKNDSYCLTVISEFIPYLRKMPDIQDPLLNELNDLITNKTFYEITAIAQDWYNKHHFDYRGLIEKGLALEAPEGMYEIVPTSI